MNARHSVQFLGAVLALTVSLAAQSTPPIELPPVSSLPPVVDPPAVANPPPFASDAPTVATLVALGYIDIPRPPLPLRPPLNLSPGTTVKFQIRSQDILPASVIWVKNGFGFAATNEVELPNLSASDSGVYAARFKTNDGKDHETDSLVVRVVAPVRQHLLNLSSRTTLSTANPVLISGFVLAPAMPHLSETKKVLIRAVGPSLAQFGVKQPLSSPVVKIFRADGSPLPPSLPYGQLWPYVDVPEVVRATGAFPLVEGAKDFAQIYSLTSGVYTIHVSSGDGGSGDVLLEIYEVPEDIYPPFIFPLFPSSL